jgi:hypothetical protein
LNFLPLGEFKFAIEFETSLRHPSKYSSALGISTDRLYYNPMDCV